MASTKHKIIRRGNRILFDDRVCILKLAEEFRFCVKSVSNELGLTTIQFESLLVSYLDINPKELFCNHRAVMARRLILEGEDRKSIINMLGFKYDSHFCYEIKRHYGLSPSQLAKQIGPTH